ncbi:hypothetical protein M378DRAFT_168712, partial [Amanita muscaria Koide BX008]
MTVIESWDLLSRCPSHGSRWPVSVPQIHLRRLHSLVLNSKSESPFSTFIEALSLPVLEELRLALKGRAVTWSATAFQSLAHRSNYFPHLRTFYLEDSNSIIDAGILLHSTPRKCIYACRLAVGDVGLGLSLICYVSDSLYGRGNMHANMVILGCVQ